MLEFTRANFNIGLNESAEMKTKNSIMQKDWISLPKLMKIFTLIILINPSPKNLWLTEMRGKKVDN